MGTTRLLCGVVLLCGSLTAVAQDQAEGKPGNPLAGLNSFLKGAVDTINNTAAQAKGGGNAQGATSSTVGRHKVADTKLAKIFASYPATGDAAPEWPKVAISISDIPREQTENHYMVHRPSANECMRFSIKLWSNAKTSEAFNDLELCGSDIAAGVSFSQIRVWKNFPVSGKTAGQVRTGPTPPYTKIPSSPLLDRWFVNESGYYYFGSLLYSLGYDWNFAPDSRRVWVEKVGG